MTEVTLGQLAVNTETHAKVKEHGQMMVRDHTKANDELKSWARKAGYTLPPAPRCCPEKNR